MILRRVIQHVRKQEWTAIWIDLVIVVVGVFIDIQVANWNEARLEERRARDVLVRLQDSATAVRQLTRLDPYFIVAWTRMRDTTISFDQRAEVEEATRQARAALAHIEAHGPKNVEYVRTLGPWALGDDSVAPQRLSAAIAEAPPGEASAYIVARRDVARYNDYVETSGAIPQAYYFANLYRSTSAGHAMLRDPRVKAKLVEYGFVAYWREKGWPAGCRPLGDADFECGLDIAGPGKS